MRVDGSRAGTAEAAAARTAKQRRAGGPEELTERLPGQPDGAPGDGWLGGGPQEPLPVQELAPMRRRRVRIPSAWVLTLPVDLVALAAPAVWINSYWRGLLAMAVVTVVVFAALSLYTGRAHLSFLDVLPALLGGLLISAAIVGVIAAERHAPLDYVAGFMRAVAYSVGLVLLGRMVTIKLVLIVRSRRWVERRAVIIGSGPIAAGLAQTLADHPRYGLQVIGYLADGGAKLPPSQLVPWLGPVRAIENVVWRTDAKVVIVADADAPDDRVIDLVRRPITMRCALFVVPRLYHVHNAGGANDHIGAIPVQRLKRPSFTGLRWFVKRTLDIIVALILLVLLSPVLFFCMLLVIIDGGPKGLFFRQERVGRNGRTFKVVKFRSMRPATESESNTQWNIAQDKRVRPIGRFLRRTSLDELPQLWNILRGDMTFVGPRPERPHFVAQFSVTYPEYADRHRVPAGLTGLAQVSGLRGDTPIGDRARFDNYYIDNWSLWLDVKVVLRTVGELFRSGKH